jgi:hypothetical protein
MIFKKNGNIVENLGDIRLFVEAVKPGRELRKKLALGIAAHRAKRNPALVS